MKSIIRWLLDNPRISFLILLFVTMAGLFAISVIPKEGNPDIQIPVAFIVVLYPGATPEVMETLVAQKIEDAMVDLPDLDQTRSDISEGLAFIRVTFTAEADLEDSINKVRERVDKVTPDLPEDCGTPEVSELSVSDMPMMTLSLSAEMEPIELRQVAEDLADDLKKVSGVLDTSVSGGQTREIQILLKPAKLAEYQVSPTQVITAIQTQHLDVPGGTVELGNQNYLLRSIGEFEDPSQMGEIIVTGSSGTNVRLDEVADIVDGPPKVTTNSRIDGQDSVTIYIKRRTGANIIDTSEAIKAMLGIPQDPMTVTLGDGREVELNPFEIRAFYFASSDEYSLPVRDGEGNVIPVTRGEVKDQVTQAEIDTTKIAALPPGLMLRIVSDETDEVNDSLDTMSGNIVQGIILVLIVLFLFMGTRSALIVSTSIPLSLLIAIAVVYFSGMTLNNMVISALILVVGMVVDNAIVVTQNIYRHMGEGFDRKTAAINATAEVAYPVFTSTLTTVFAFMPILLMTGMIGKFMSFIPIVVTIALLASLFVGLFLNPPISARLLTLKRSREDWERADSSPLVKRLHQLRAWVDRTFDFQRMGRWYERVVQKAFQRRKLVFTVTILSFLAAVSLPMLGLIKVELFPPGDVDSLTVSLETPLGTPLEVTDAKVREVERIVAEQIPEMERYVATSGSAGGRAASFFGFTNTNEGEVTVDLVPSEDRERTASEIRDSLRPYLTQIPGVDFSYSETLGGPPTGSAVNIKIYGDDLDVQREISGQILAFLEGQPGVKDPHDDIAQGTPELQARIRREEANLLGFTSYNLGMGLRTLVTGSTAAEYRVGDKEYDITVKLPDDYLRTTSDLKTLFVSNSAGSLVMVGDVAKVSPAEGIGSIKHYNGERAVTVEADMLAGYSPVETTLAVKDYVERNIVLPTGYRIDYEGSSQFIAESFSSLGIAFVLALLLIFLILTLQFHSFAQTLTVMATIVLSTVGAIAGLAITGSSFTIVSFVALVGLAGVAVNGAIILVDFINIRRAEGMRMREAIVDAGKIRLAPIMLTAITTIGGMIPLALSNPQWAPLGWCFIFGLSVATILTLIVIPTIYDWIEEWKIKVKKKLFKNYVPPKGVLE